ncbi:MAG: flavin reductase family protein [Candidatus Dormibacteraceae bacterium]
MEVEAFLEAMARLPTALVVVSTTTGPGRFRGMTATSFTSASLEPALVAVSLERLTATRDALQESGRFNVSVLSDRQEFVAERFAGRAPLVDAGWREIPHRLGGNGIPIVTGSIAWFECELRDLVETGDHDFAVGVVREAGSEGGNPLVHWLRAFWKLTG